MSEQREQALYRAAQAQRVVGDPMVREALDTIKAAIREQVFDLPVEATEQREKLVMMDKMRQQFERYFELALSGGEVARRDLLNEQHTATRLDAIRERARSYG